MELGPIFKKIRPNAVWTDNRVNFYDLTTTQACYDGDDFPTQTEINAGWKEVKKDLLIPIVKEAANKRILELVPEWTDQNHDEKQRNSLMKAARLLRKEQKGTISAGEATELDNFDVLGNSIDAIRDASDSIETEIENLSTLTAINNYDVETNVLWP